MWGRAVFGVKPEQAGPVFQRAMPLRQGLGLRANFRVPPGEEDLIVENQVGCSGLAKRVVFCGNGRLESGQRVPASVGKVRPCSWRGYVQQVVERQKLVDRLTSPAVGVWRRGGKDVMGWMMVGWDSVCCMPGLELGLRYKGCLCRGSRVSAATVSSAQTEQTRAQEDANE